jgi:hypothetical protein
MWIESWALNEEEKKKKKISEKDIQENNLKNLEHKKIKEKISVEMKTEKELDKLKNLIEKWIISKETAEKIVEWKDVWEEIIKEIFEKIDQIEEIKDIDKYIPEHLRVTKEDYSKALNDDIFRVQLITRLDSSLALIANKINPDSAMWLNLFSWFLTVLDKNLIIVQENTIDVKDSLKKIDEQKFWVKADNRTLWEKILDFFKEI